MQRDSHGVLDRESWRRGMERISGDAVALVVVGKDTETRGLRIAREWNECTGTEQARKHRTQKTGQWAGSGLDA